MNVKQKLRKGLTLLQVLAITAGSTVSFYACNNKGAQPEPMMQQETSGVYEREQEIKLQLPVNIFIDSSSIRTKRHLDSYVKAFRRLDQQAESVEIDLIGEIIETTTPNPSPRDCYVIKEGIGIDYPGLISHTISNGLLVGGYITVDDSLPLEQRVRVATRLLMKSAIGESTVPGDLTFELGTAPLNHQTKLSDRELYRLAEIYGNVKVPR